MYDCMNLVYCVCKKSPDIPRRIIGNDFAHAPKNCRIIILTNRGPRIHKKCHLGNNLHCPSRIYLHNRQYLGKFFLLFLYPVKRLVNTIFIAIIFQCATSSSSKASDIHKKNVCVPLLLIWLLSACSNSMLYVPNNKAPTYIFQLFNYLGMLSSMMPLLDRMDFSYYPPPFLILNPLYEQY